MFDRIKKILGIQNIRVILFFFFFAVLQLSFYLYFYEFISFDIYKKNIVFGIYCFAYFNAEFLVAAVLTIWLFNKNIYMKSICIILIILFLIICSFQLLSFYYSNSFINADLAVQASNINLLINPFSSSIVIVPLIIFIIFLVYLQKKYEQSTVRQKVFSTILILIVISVNIYGIYSSNKFHNNIVKTQRYLNIYGNTPVSSIVRAAYKVFFYKDSKIELTKKDITLGREYGFVFQPDKQFPFIKGKIYAGKTKDSSKEYIKPNIIVFFAESLSAVKLGCYSSKYSNITPSIDKFAEESLIIKKYYNHVSPTVRAIIGQLCSTYPEFGYHTWKSFDLKTPPSYSLPKLLTEEGYDNIYLSASDPNATYLEDQLRNIGYQKTYFSDTFGEKFLNGEEGILNSSDFSDHQMMLGLINYLELNKNRKNPFFITISNIETHVNLDVSKDGFVYDNGKSSVLNTTFNFDHAFGLFWSYFKKSKYYNNTIVVLTADHAHFPSMKFVKIAGKKFQKLYCDEIAFVVYNPISKVHGSFYAYSSSIDFAPSIVEILGFQNRKNSFIGQSIFSDRKYNKGGIGIFRDKIFLIDKKGLKSFSLKDTSNPRVNSLYKLIRYSQQIQNSNRLWHN